MFCTQCGHQNPDGSRFCARCGAAVPGPVGGGGATSGPADTTSTISLSAVEGALAGGEAGHSAPEPALDPPPAGTALLVVKRGPNAGSRFLLDAAAYQALLP